MTHGIFATGDDILPSKLNKGLVQERYTNHTMVHEAYITTSLIGSGTYMEYPYGYYNVLDTGISSFSHASVFTVDSCTLSSSKFIIMNYIMKTHTAGAGAGLVTRIGLINNITNFDNYSQCCFVNNSGGSWYVYTSNATSLQSTSLSISNGDKLTIYATNTFVNYYVNKYLVVSHTLYIPTLPLFSGYGVRTSSANTSTRTLESKYFDLRIIYNI